MQARPEDAPLARLWWTLVFLAIGASAAVAQPVPARKTAQAGSPGQAFVELSAAARTFYVQQPIRLRVRFGELLREEVSRTLEDPAAVDEELRALLSALGAD